MTTVRLAVAIILDDAGRMLTVRKRGTSAFMQPGGKIEHGEAADAALARELREELGLDVNRAECRWISQMSAPAAFEPGIVVEADVFHVTAIAAPAPGAEIEQLAWVDSANTQGLALAHLTRDCILPLIHSLQRDAT